MNNMEWKDQLRKLEQQEKWDEAVSFMENILKENSNNLDAYLFMNYLLMDFLAEPHDRDENNDWYYEYLVKKFYDAFYKKFAYHPDKILRAEYLYYTGITAVLGEWYFGIKQDDYITMIEKAQELDPDNIVYKYHYYDRLAEKGQNISEVCRFAYMILQDNSPFKKILDSKGTLGEYIFGMRANWAKNIVADVCSLMN